MASPDPMNPGLDLRGPHGSTMSIDRSPSLTVSSVGLQRGEEFGTAAPALPR